MEAILPPVYWNGAGAKVLTPQRDARTPVSLQYLLRTVDQELYTIK